MAIMYWNVVIAQSDHDMAHTLANAVLSPASSIWLVGTTAITGLLS